MKTFVCSAACLVLGFWSANSEEINPYPRVVLSTEKLVGWSFASDSAGWKALHDCTVTATNGLLQIHCSGNDPYISSPAFQADGLLAFKLRARCAGGGQGQIFWMTTAQPGTTEECSEHFKLIHDSQWHEYSVSFQPTGTVTLLRFDPGSAPGLIELESAEVDRVRLHPLELQSVHASGRTVELQLQNHGENPLPISVQEKNITLPAHNSQKLSVTLAGSSPFESREIVVTSTGLPEIRRRVMIVDPGQTADWISLKSSTLTLLVAPDGSGAKIESSGQLVGVIAPLINQAGVLPELKLAKRGSTVQFEGKGISIELSVEGDEIHTRLRSDTEVEGPVLRAFGALEQGVFAGQEYLAKGEHSSSTLDIETDEHIRFAPNPLAVTMPLMAFVTDRTTAAMSWQEMTLQPIYATPNFLDGAEGHRAALRGKQIDATILIRKPAPMEEAILWAVKRRGLPELPKPPRERQAQLDFCLKALSGPPLKTEEGWAHCAEKHWPHHPFSDHASTVWRLTGQAPSLPKLVPGGSHIPNDAIFFVTGRANEWLKWKAAQIKGVLAEQKDDGSFRYTGKYQRGHYEDTASGYCGLRARMLLEHARYTGDSASLQAGLKALEFMKHFRDPRGAQTWECALHTPDILASAYLVQAYVLAHELTGQAEYLERARAWAITGLPFVYQWGCKPTMVYATIAVYGATNWRAPNWIGLPVQWCGYDYAYALTALAPLDSTLDWKKLATGILYTAEQMQYTDGEFAGCEPDSFNLAEQTRNPWNINPCSLVSLRLVLEGKLDSLAVATAEGHRIVSPFPVSISNGQAQIHAREGAVYQVIVDGQRIVEVTSHGEDSVPLVAK